MYWCIVRDSSAVRRLFVRLVGAVGRQSALHTENSGFAAPTLVRHISTFRGYRILFSIQNPFYINRFTNHFSIHSQQNVLERKDSSYPQKVVLHSITARFCLRPYHFAIWLSFSNFCHVTSRKLWLPQCNMGMICIYDLTLSKIRGGENVTHALSEAIESFLSNTFCIISFCSDLSCRWNCLSCRIRFISSSMWFVCCCLRMQIIWCAALSSSHHAMRCCHHSVSITRSRL